MLLGERTVTPSPKRVMAAPRTAASSGNSSATQQLVLLSISPSLTIKLKKCNFLIWKNQLLNMIMANGLEGYINGRTVEPLEFLDAE